MNEGSAGGPTELELRCDCREKMVDAITERVKAKHPDVTELEVEMEGYGLAMNMGTGAARFVPCFPVRITGRVPKSKGDGTKALRTATSAVASFCPFCGVRYPTEEEPRAALPPQEVAHA